MIDVDIDLAEFDLKTDDIIPIEITIKDYNESFRNNIEIRMYEINFLCNGVWVMLKLSEEQYKKLREEIY